MSGLFLELKRRNVFRVAIAYFVASWLLVQAADLVLDVIGAADWVLRSVVVLLALGFLPAVVISWVFEMTPEGVKKESEIDRGQSITHQTAKKLDMVTIGLLVAAITLVALDRYLPGLPAPGDVAVSEVASAPVTDASNSATEQAPVNYEKTIAVLPFANRSNQDDDLFFTDGIHDDLLTQLAKIHDLKVISRTSVMEYRDTTKNLREIGAELGVSAILEGGIQKVGNRVRINSQLIEVETDRHLWAESYDRELTAENIFDIQSEIAREIVRAVAIELTPEEERSINEIPTRNLAAYEAWLRAREYLNSANYSANNEREAKPWLEKAIALDPDFSEAHALLANVYGAQYWRGLDTSEELLAKYRGEIERAMQLNPGSPTALLASAEYHYRVKNDYRKSLQLVNKALEMAPGNADAYANLALTQRRLGRWQESIASFGKALELDPANRFYKMLQVETMGSTRDWQEIINQTVSLEDANTGDLDIQVKRAAAQLNLTGDLGPLQRVFEQMTLEATSDYVQHSARVHWLQRDADAVIDTLNNPIWMEVAERRAGALRVFRYYELANAYRLQGDQDKALEQYQMAIGELEDAMNSVLQVKAYGGMTVALSMARIDRLDEALALALQLTREIPYEKDSMLWGWLLTYQAMIKGLAGDQEAAIDDLRIAFEIPTAFPITAWDLHYDPNWDFMRDNPHFVELSTPDNLIRTQTP
jgi:TolB-like protein/Tfp pilus assembly protein PilF